MYTKKLTARSRIGWIMGVVASVVFTGYGVVLALTTADPAMRAVWWAYTVGQAVMILFAAIVLRRGQSDARQYLSFSKMSPALALFIAILLAARAMAEPSIPALAWALIGVVWLVLALAVVLYNRVMTAELTTREQLLRLELRMMELAEKRNA